MIMSCVSGSLSWKHNKDECNWMEAVGGERFGFGRMMVEPVEIAQVMGCMS
jgi:hypothetical protein